MGQLDDLRHPLLWEVHAPETWENQKKGFPDPLWQRVRGGALSDQNSRES